MEPTPTSRPTRSRRTVVLLAVAAILVPSAAFAAGTFVWRTASVRADSIGPLRVFDWSPSEADWQEDDGGSYSYSSSAGYYTHASMPLGGPRWRATNGVTGRVLAVSANVTLPSADALGVTEYFEMHSDDGTCAIGMSATWGGNEIIWWYEYASYDGWEKTPDEVFGRTLPLSSSFSVPSFAGEPSPTLEWDASLWCGHYDDKAGEIVRLHLAFAPGARIVVDNFYMKVLSFG